MIREMDISQVRKARKQKTYDGKVRHHYQSVRRERRFLERQMKKDQKRLNKLLKSTLNKKEDQ